MCLSYLCCFYCLSCTSRPSDRARTLATTLNMCYAHCFVLLPVSVVCEQTLLLEEPLPCNTEAETALQPLIWHSERGVFWWGPAFAREVSEIRLISWETPYPSKRLQASFIRWSKNHFNNLHIKGSLETNNNFMLQVKGRPCS